MEGKYEKLRSLIEQEKFPLVYPFKFIFQQDTEKLIQIKQIFDETAEISVRASKNGKYSSITIKQMMLHPDEIILRYERMEQIEGVITL